MKEAKLHVKEMQGKEKTKKDRSLENIRLQRKQHKNKGGHGSPRRKRKPRKTKKIGEGVRRGG